MGAMADYRDFDYACGHGLSLGDPHPKYGYVDGYFQSAQGFVLVFINPRCSPPRTHLQFAWEGRIYNRDWRCLFGARTVARLAREFVVEIASR